MSALAHDLAGGLAPPDWPPLTAAELAPILAHYPAAGAVRHLAWHSQRPLAASGIVACVHGPVFIKRHDSRVRTPAQLAEEHAFIAHLRQHGAPVPAVLATADGATALASYGRSYEVHALATGTDTYRDAHSWTPARTPADAAAIGHALAHLHTAAAGFDAPARHTTLLVAGDALLRAPDFAAAIAATCRGQPALAAALATRPWQADFARNLAPLHAALQPHMANLPPLWVHADAHASNVFWHRGAVSAVLDFGLCNRASAVFDLATALERNTIAWLTLTPGHTQIGRPDLARALLAAYHAARPLTGAELAALPHLLPLVHVDFALSELAYFHGITRHAADADSAYVDFLLNHARWFGTADGLEFLERGCVV